MNPNPYELLKLPPSATEEEIVRRAGQLRQRVADEDAQTAIRQAVQSLTGPPEERLLHAILTYPAPHYSWPTVEKLAAAFRRPPPSDAPADSPPPEVDLTEFAAILRPLLAEELAPTPLPYEQPPVEETPAEVRRQTVEGLWQNLFWEPGA